jgi:hypothetical protein
VVINRVPSRLWRLYWRIRPHWRAWQLRQLQRQCAAIARTHQATRTCLEDVLTRMKAKGY